MRESHSACEFSRRGWTTVDTLRRTLRCYIITSGLPGCPGFPAWGVFRHEVVPVEHQTRRAICAVCACRSVRAFVRSFSRRRCSSRAVDPVRRAATAGVQSRFRSAPGRFLRDLRGDRSGKHGVVRSASDAAAAASRGIPLPDLGRGVRRSELRIVSVSAARTPALLTSIVE